MLIYKFTILDSPARSARVLTHSQISVQRYIFFRYIQAPSKKHLPTRFLPQAKNLLFSFKVFFGRNFDNSALRHATAWSSLCFFYFYVSSSLHSHCILIAFGMVFIGEVFFRLSTRYYLVIHSISNISAKKKKRRHTFSPHILPFYSTIFTFRLVYIN